MADLEQRTDSQVIFKEYRNNGCHLAGTAFTRLGCLLGAGVSVYGVFDGERLEVAAGLSMILVGTVIGRAIYRARDPPHWYTR